MNEQPTGKNGPLEGLRVIDWTMWQFGPVSTMMLADLGAEVIKVESLDGDHARQFHRVSGAASTLPGDLNAYFQSLNRQKMSLAVDLKTEKGKEIMYRLVEESDVFVQNFRPGVVERLGIGESDIRARSPNIVYVSISGFGEQLPGPLRVISIFFLEACRPILKRSNELQDIHSKQRGRI